MDWKFKILPVTVFLFLGLAFIALAIDFTSTDFGVKDPVLFSAGYSTSSSFQLFSTMSQPAIGTSSASSFQLRGGFLYFPIVTAPTVTVTAGDASISLAWTAATADGGWSIGGYNVGRSTVSGGPYTYSTSLGNVTSSNRTGLSNGTLYYFIVRAEDALGNSIATSTEVSSTPVASAVADTTTTGGGGGILRPSAGAIVLSGFAYPRARITILKDSQAYTSAIAAVDGRFSVTVSVFSYGTHYFGVLAQDMEGRRSPLVPIPVKVSGAETVTVSDILIPPTIDTDKEQVRSGEQITVGGNAFPNSRILLSLAHGADLVLFSVFVDGEGNYAYNINTADLEEGIYIVSGRMVLGDRLVSKQSFPLRFSVGDVTVVRPPPIQCSAEGIAVLVGDLNGDCRVNLVDFSILVYWQDQKNPPPHVDVNGDGGIDLTDFSIVAFYWTG